MKKFTAKQLRGYYKAKQEWISANDYYNLSVFGIDQAQYKIIRSVENSVFGICQGTEKLTLKALNNSLQVKGK